jgi:hypothetical protein
LQHGLLFEGVVAVARASRLLALEQSPVNDAAFQYHFNNTKRVLQLRVDSPDNFADDLLLTLAALSTVDVSAYPSKYAPI